MTTFLRTSLLASLLCCAFGVSAMGQGFVTAPVLPVAGDPQLLASADFNGDGKPDLAYLDALNGGNLHILLGNGDGSFRTSQVIAIAGNITGQIDTADLNGDGVPDLVLGSAGVITLLGRGDGTFKLPVATTGANYGGSGHAAIADFDGDGKPDVFLASSGSGVLFKGDGKGGFSGTIELPGSTAGGPDAFAVDLNGDGLPDLVVANGMYGFAVSLNRGNGVFASSVSYPFTSPQQDRGVGCLAVLDVNGDGHPDVLFPGESNFPGQLVAMLGRADGTFAAAAPVAATGVHDFQLVGAADLRGDGRRRVFLAGSEGFGTVLGGSPAGTPMFEGSGIRQEQTVLADVNGDGLVDMVTPDNGSLVVLLGKADGTFASGQAQQIGSTIGSIQLADVNGDHVPDLLVSSALIFAGLGDGTFASTPLQTPSGYGTANSTYGSTFPFYPANLNGDGKLDLLALPEAHLVGDGRGGFTQVTPPRVMGTPFYYGAVADFDGDGLDDTVQIALGGSPPLGGVNIFMSRAQSFTAFGLPNNEASGPAATGDFDGDGCQDLAVTGTSHVVLYRGDCQGNLTFTQRYSFDLPPSSSPAQVDTRPGDIARADIDGDGRPDLVITLPLLNEAQIYYGNGDGTFTSAAPLRLSRSAIYVSAADLDGDGRADLVFSGIGDPILLYGAATRVLGAERVLAAGFQSGKAALADLRGIGKVDLVFPNVYSYSYRIFNNVGFTYTRFLNAGPAPGTSAVTVSLNLPSGAMVYGAAHAAVVSVSATNSGAVPSGFVSLQVDGVPLASAALDSHGQASLPLSAVDAGSHTLQVNYLGDVNFRTASASGVLSVSAAPTSLVVTSSPAHSTTLQAVTLTATVTSPSLAPNGQVSFSDGGTALGSASIDRTGRATLVVPALAAGAHPITAVFAGGQDFGGSQSQLSQQVNPAVSATAVTVTPANSYLGANVAIAVAVSGGASPYPSGVVACSDGALNLGTITLGGGSGSLSTSALPAGASSVVCTYAGDAVFAPSTSASVPVNVSVRYPSTIALGVSAGGAAVTTVPAGTTVTLTAQVSANGMALVQGQVVFCNGASLQCTDIHRLGTAQLTASGTATLAITPGPGTHSYTARFPGLPTAQPMVSSASALQVTGNVLSAATLTASGAPGSYALTAQISGVGPAPTGTVSFLDVSNGGAVLGSAALSPASGTAPFTAGALPTPGVAGTVRSADLNGDGHPDFAVATGPSGGIQILLGRGDGTFATGQMLHSTTGSVSATTTAMVFGDFNGDGQVDLAAVNNFDKSLAVFFGVGDGTFRSTPVVTTATSAFDVFSLAVADVNGDGKADLVGAAEVSGTAVVLLGNGDGTFGNILTQGVSPYPRKVIVGDFNEDGLPDLVFTTGGQGALSVLLGVGDGTFRAVAAPALGGVPISAVAADVNGDGHLDLAVTDDAGTSVRILLGQGDGTFQVQGAVYATGTTPIEIVAGDFNGDGLVDLAVANELSDSVTLLLGKGDGSFTPSVVATGVQPEFLAAADVNADGRTDLLVGNVGESDATLLLAQGSGVATATLASVAPPGPGTHVVQASYGGDGTYAPRTTNSVSLAVSAAATTLSLVATPAQGTYGQTIRLTATLVPASSGSSTSDGEAIRFSNGTAVLGTCALQGGTCSLALPALDAGSYLFAAQYAGDAVLAASSSASVPVNVAAVAAPISFSVANHTFGDAPFAVSATSPATGAISYAVVSGPATVSGSTVTLTGAGMVVLRADQAAAGNYAAASQSATFTVAPAAQSIRFNLPATAVFGGPALSVTAQASSGLPVALTVVSGPAVLSGSELSFTGTGAVVLAADQAGNANYGAAAQVRQTLQVSPAAVALTWPGTAPLPYGSTLRSALNATATSGSTTVPGSVAYTLNGTAVSAATVLNAGVYVLQAAFTPANSALYTGVTATASVTITKAATGVVLTTPASAIFTGTPLVLTATVSSAAGPPTGSVTFLNGAMVLGTVSVSSGVAQLRVASLPVGTEMLSAAFSGGDNYVGASSASVAEEVQDFSVTTPTQSPVVTAVGNTATTTFTLNATGQMLPQAVSFSASGLPPGATATFSPASLPAGSTATAVTVTFTLANTTASAFRHRGVSGVAYAMLLLVPMAGLGSRRRRRALVRGRQGYVLAALFAVLCVGVTGCGGGASSSAPTNPLPQKSYVVTLTATSGTLQRSTTVTLQVN